MARHNFEYKNVEILEDKQVGFGAYGTVCLAKCDDLICAAKIIHKAFFDHRDPGAVEILKRFEQECEFVSKIHHPNIVQYLGIYRNKKLSNGPILLMELLDDNLTNYLRKQGSPLEFHVQVDICHDIALAVAYLHSNKIMHRDLSSNNVLLVGDAARAKVVDFGVAKLEESSFFKRKCVTQLPGTTAYMPPEVLNEKPDYNEKIDCFSIGVLILQILTLLFPNPGPRTQTREDASSATGTIEDPVLEVERRRNHIDLVDPNHHLLPLARECLSYSHKGRPSASLVCQRLATLKESELYRKSQRGRSTKYAEEIVKDCKIRQLEERIVELEHELKTRTPLRKSSAPPSFNIPKREIGNTPVPMASGSVAVRGHVAYFRPSQSGEVYEFDSTTKKWSNTPSCKRKAFSLAVIGGLLTAVGGFDEANRDTSTLLSLSSNQRRRRKWTEHFPPMPTKRSYCAVVVTGKHLIVAGGMMGISRILDIVELMDIASKTWYRTGSLMCPLSEACAAVSGTHVYLTGGYDHAKHWTRSIYSCSLSALEAAAQPTASSDPPIETPKVWVPLTNLSISRTFCVVVQNSLLVVCGKRDSLRTDIVWRYNLASNAWVERERLSCARSRCLVAVFPGDKLMIVGGWGNSRDMLQSYEMVDLSQNS